MISGVWLVLINNVIVFLFTMKTFLYEEGYYRGKQAIVCTDTCLLTYLPSYTQMWTCTVVVCSVISMEHSLRLK